MSAHSIPVYGVTVSVDRIRRVWAAVTQEPQASVRELGAALDMSYGDVARALVILRDAGYIERAYFRSARARRIIVPFVEVEHERSF